MGISRTVAFLFFAGFVAIILLLVFFPGNMTQQQLEYGLVAAILFASLGGVFLKWGKAILS